MNNSDKTQIPQLIEEACTDSLDILLAACHDLRLAIMEELALLHQLRKEALLERQAHFELSLAQLRAELENKAL
jgi:hypothetical protein